MNKIFRRLLVITIGQFLAINAFAAANVNYLNIDGDAVHFSIAEAKTSTSPNCVVAETNDRFAVSLKTETGRAMYSLLITAMASKQAISVESALDCADVSGLERAKGVSIVPIVHEAAEGNSLKPLNLYKGDGVTKLGRIISMKAEDSFYYLPVDNTKIAKTYTNTQLVTIIDRLYFETNDCSGAAYTTTQYQKGSFPLYNNGKLYISSASVSKYNQSRLFSDGNCYPHTGTHTSLAPIAPHTDALCGDAPCIIKEG